MFLLNTVWSSLRRELINLTSITYSVVFFFFSSRRRHTRFKCDWSSDVCSSDLSCATLRRSRFLSAVDFVQADRLRRKVAQEMARIFEGVDLLLVPSLRDEILKIGRASCRERV